VDFGIAQLEDEQRSTNYFDRLPVLEPVEEPGRLQQLAAAACTPPFGVYRSLTIRGLLQHEHGECYSTAEAGRKHCDFKSS